MKTWSANVYFISVVKKIYSKILIYHILMDLLLYIELDEMGIEISPALTIE